MKSAFNLIAAGLFLTAATAGLSQPVITQQPQPCTNALGSTATFTVSANGTEPLSYQWQKLSGNWTDLADCTANSLCLTNVQTSHAGEYRVAVTNADGAVTSEVARLTVIVAPVIPAAGQPTNFAPASLGATVGNRVIAYGSAPFAFQWCLNEVRLPLQTNASLVLTNVQFADSGGYSVVVTNLAGGVTSKVVRLTVDPLFAKVSGSPWSESGNFVVPAWGDYDSDGLPDLFVAQTQSKGNRLYHNNGDGTFTRMTDSAVSQPSDLCHGGAWGDYDNDGDLDLYVANGHMLGARTNFFYQNNGDGTFTRIINSAVVGAKANSSAPVWSDYDRDGHLDLFVPNRGGQNNWLFRNLGDGSFTQIKTQLTAIATCISAAWGDYDNDGFPDLFVANVNNTACFLYHNQGNGTFTRITSGPIATDSSATWMGGDWGDYDNDGDLDLYVTTLSGGNRLYRNNGDGTFTRVTGDPVVNAGDQCIQGSWGDYDNDGWLDLYVARGEKDARTSRLYHNKGDGTFEEITNSVVVSDSVSIGACAWADYDNDGCLDLYVSRGGYGTAIPSALFHNHGGTNAWLKVRLVGTASNRGAVGSKVRVKALTGGRELWQLREAGGIGGVGGQSPLTVHFGLADAAVVATLRIEWPSGLVQELRNVPVRQHLTVTEPARLAMPQPGVLQIQCWKGMACCIEGSSDLATWTPLAALTNLDLIGRVQWTDSAAPGLTTRFYRAREQ